MNRRVTGWLAWSALALIIGVPSVEMALSDAERPAAADVAESAAGNAFFGPVPAPKKTANDPFALPENPPAEDDAGQAVAEAEKPQTAAKAEAADTEPDKVAMETAEKDETADAATGIRVVGAPRVLREPGGPAANSGLWATGGAADQATETGSAEAAADSGALQPIESRTGTPGMLETALASEAGDVVAGGKGEQLRQTAAIAKAPAVAPQPMPAYLRPTPPAQVATTSFEEDVRQSIENIRTARDRVEPVPDDGQLIWSRDPYRTSYDYDDPYGDPYDDGGETLEPFAPGEFAPDDYAGDSAFYQAWRTRRQPQEFRNSGSFTEQLPARRGTGIRLDLLQ